MKTRERRVEDDRWRTWSVLVFNISRFCWPQLNFHRATLAILILFKNSPASAVSESVQQSIVSPNTRARSQP